MHDQGGLTNLGASTGLDPWVVVVILILVMVMVVVVMVMTVVVEVVVMNVVVRPP